MKIKDAFSLLKEEPYYDEAYRQYTSYKSAGGKLLDAQEFLRLSVKGFDGRHVAKVEKELLEKNKKQKKSKDVVKKDLLDEFLGS